MRRAALLTQHLVRQQVLCTLTNPGARSENETWSHTSNCRMLPHPRWNLANLAFLPFFTLKNVFFRGRDIRDNTGVKSVNIIIKTTIDTPVKILII